MARKYIEGPFEHYYNNGQLSSKGEWRKFKQHGLWEEYFSDGKPWEKGEYKNNKKRGLWYQSQFNK